MIRCGTFVLICAGLGAAAAQAQTVPVACPATIHTTQRLTGTAPEGWTPVPSGAATDKAKPQDEPNSLAGVQFSTGHPSQQAFLVPDDPKGTRTRNGFRQRWTFDGAEAIYISCGYTQTSVVLSRALPAGTKSCDVTFDSSTQPPMATAVSCRK